MLITIGIGLAPAGILTGIDLTSQLVNEHCEKGCTPGFKYMGLFIGYLFTQWCTLEATRVYITILVPAISICKIILFILYEIQKRELNMKTLLLYHELYCINQILAPHVSILAGVIMSFGMIIFVFGNWMILSVWNLVPREIYFINVGVIALAYFIVYLVFPLVIKVNEVSTEIICRWKIDSNFGFRRRSYWRKKLIAQQSVAFYYAMTKFEKDTQVNYCSFIVDNTVNALVLF